MQSTSYGLGPFSDISDDEFDALFPMFNKTNSTTTPESAPSLITYQGGDLPESIDWWKEGHVTRVRPYHSNCLAQSYAMSAADMVEALHMR